MVHFAVRGLPLSSSRSVFQLSCQPTKSLYIRSWGCDPPSFVMHIKCIGPFDWCFFFFFLRWSPGKQTFIYHQLVESQLYCTLLACLLKSRNGYIYMYGLDISSEKGSSSSSSIYHSIRALVIAYYERYVKFIFTSILLCFCSISLQSTSSPISHTRIIFTHGPWFLI